MIDFVKSASCESVLMENLEACMQQGIAISPTTIEVPCNTDLPNVEECATTPLRMVSMGIPPFLAFESLE